MSEKQVLICDKCSAENWNLASEGKSHDQRANEVKGYDACDGIWRFPRNPDADRQPGKLILFPARQKDSPEAPEERLVRKTDEPERIAAPVRSQPRKTLCR